MYQTQTKRCSRCTSKHFHRLAMPLIGISFFLGISAADPLGAQSIPPQVTRVEAAGIDGNVTFFPGSPGPLEGGFHVVVTSPTCGEMGRVFVPVPTETGTSTAEPTVEVTVPDILSQVLACGAQYTVALEDSLGSVGLALPFRVDLSCDISFQCDFRLFPWIEIDNALTFSPTLDQALAQATGSGDLVGSVLAGSPQLRDEVSSYALHLETWLTAQGTGLTNNCFCQWTGRLEHYGPMDPSGAPRYAALACPTKPVDDRSGGTMLTTATRCHTLGSGSGTLWTLPGGQVLTMPSFDRCVSLPVPPDIGRFRLTFDGRAAAGGVSGHLTEAAIQVELELDHEVHSSGTAVALRGAADPWSLDSVPLTLDSGWVVATSGTVWTYSMAEVTTSGSASPPPLIGAASEGILGIEATNSIALSTIKLWGPINDSYDEGGDPEGCGDGLMEILHD